MCQYKFINSNKCLSLVGDIDNEQIMHLSRQEVCEKLMHLPLKLPVNLKVL